MKQFTRHTIAVLTIFTLASSSCKKEEDPHIPPDMTFKTGTTYTSGDATIGLGDTVTVGVVVTKMEDDLRTFNLSYSYDGGSPVTSSNYSMTAAEYTGYDHDFQIIARNQAGSEKWTFTVTDRDGNVTQKSITLTVQ